MVFHQTSSDMDLVTLERLRTEFWGKLGKKKGIFRTVLLDRATYQDLQRTLNTKFPDRHDNFRSQSPKSFQIMLEFLKNL